MNCQGVWRNGHFYSSVSEAHIFSNAGPTKEAAFSADWGGKGWQPTVTLSGPMLDELRELARMKASGIF